MKRGYIEWVNIREGYGIITNSFKRILYMNSDYPDGGYERWKGGNITIGDLVGKENHFKVNRNLTKEELMLELL